MSPGARLAAFALPAGPLLAVLLYFGADAAGQSHALAATLGLTGWCALWWVFEPVKAPVTALLDTSPMTWDRWSRRLRATRFGV